MTHYKTDRLDLHLMDCMDLMRGYPDKHFDLAIVDPPYGIGAAEMQLGKGKGTASRTWTTKSWDSAIPAPEYFDELRRVSREQIIWGGNYFPLRPTRCWIIWDKIQEFSGSEFEMAWVSLDAPTRAFRMSRVEAYAGTDKIHPTQKPVELYGWLLANYAKAGDKILDTHLGSMSHAIAAHYAGLHLTGAELDPDYFAAGIERVKRETAQMDMFADSPKIAQPETLSLL